MAARMRTGGSPFVFLCAFALFAITSLRAQQVDQAPIRQNAISLEEEGRNAEAEQVWASIAKADARNAEALAHLGLLAARQQHYETAIDYYRRALVINSDLPGLRLNLGLALFKVGQFPDAIKSLSVEINKHPGDLRLTILLGMAHYGMKDYLVAIPYLQRAIEHDPENLPLRTTLARSCLCSKQYQCVVKVLEDIRALSPESAKVDMLAGEAFDRLQQTDAALKAFQAAVLANPKEPNVHFGLGYLLWGQGKWQDAANEFDLELQNDPQHLEAQIYRADAWIRLNDLARALPELEELKAEYPSEPRVHLDLGIAYADAGKNEDAIRELRTAMQYDPANAEAPLRLIKTFRSMGRMDEANAQLDVLKGQPGSARPSLQEMIDSIETPTP